MFKSRLSSYFSDWKKFFQLFLNGLKPALQAFLITLILSSLLAPLYYLAPTTNDLLSEARGTWWGILTSMFVHSGLDHFANNIGSLFLFVIVFGISNEYYPKEVQLSRASFFRWNVFFSALVANALYLIRFNTMSRGASGIVFAAEGVTLGFAFVNMIPPSLALKELSKHFREGTNRRRGLRNLLIFTVLFGWFVLYPTQFLFVGPSVNAFVHFYAFYIGFASSGAYEIVRQYKPHIVRLFRERFQG